jgi:hypothetical protein
MQTEVLARGLSAAGLEANTESKPAVLETRQPGCYEEIESDSDFDVSYRSQTLYYRDTQDTKKMGAG